MNPETSVPVNREEWSESSKRSDEYRHAHDIYLDINFFCRHCNQASTFTAAEQKERYEVCKAYIRQSRMLCPDCYKARLEIEQHIRLAQQQWADDKAALSTDLPFLQHWHALLMAHIQYGGRRDEGHLIMLNRLMHEAPRTV